ncbi:MAG: RagB/SusD family nutrient uptake outer membrane protein [Bacteroidales bacterium]|nr:RagB/SusD family nutrient uptake outer membrane protein [Bacteroidales bacterium]
MKNTLKIFAVAVLCSTAFSSCHSDLDIPYDNALSVSNMWKDPSDLEQSVPGIYYRMRSYFSAAECNVFYLGETRVGDYMWGPSLESKVQDNFKIACRHNTLTPSNTIGWSGLYSAIDQANAVIKYAEQCHATQDRVDWAYAQAYFARAFCYFYAARIWGWVPVNLLPVESTNQEECYPRQKTPDEVYAQVENDILACEPIADKLGSEKYFGTKDAFNMLKAEYALWMYSTREGGSKYLDMAQEALNAIGISESKLLADYDKIFDRTNKKNGEIVFSVALSSSVTGGYQVYFCQPSNLIASAYRNNPVPISSTQWWSYSQNFVDELKASEAKGDSRVKTNLGYGPYSSAADKHEITWCNKLLGDMSKSPVVMDNDLIYYRYAYAVMLDAELKYYRKDYAGANRSLNMIAKRAYGKDNYYVSTSASDVLDNIVKEYFLEFPAEGMIWWALIRTGRIWSMEPNSEIPGQTFETLRAKNPNILLWPILQSSINKNSNLHQIAGWS